jgi:two-component system, sensor histidine kinase
MNIYLDLKKEILSSINKHSKHKIIIECLFLGFLYFTTAKLGQLYAIHPGNITPVWIPSGIILAAIYFRGLYLLPGIFIGAFVGNAWAYISLDSLWILTRSIIAASMNGIGDMLCAYIGYRALKSLPNGALPHRNLKSLAFFLCYAAIAGSLVSAVFGIGAMGSLKMIPPDKIFYSGMTWFIGDFIGVLWVGGFLFVLSTKSYTHEYEHQHQHNLKENYYFFIIFIIVGILSISDIFKYSHVDLPHYLFLPLLAWAILRIGEKTAFYALIFFGALQIHSYYHINIDIGETQRTLNIIKLQILLSITSITLLMINAIVFKQQSLIKEVKRMREEAIQSNHFKTRFLSAMNHEIRTPLNGIVGLSDILSETELSENQNSAIEDIRKCSKHLMMLTNDILDISKIEKGKFSLNKNAFSIEELLNTLNVIFGNSCKDKNIDLSLITIEKIPEKVIGDEVRIRQVLVNLISNAIKYTKTGNVEVSINNGDKADAIIFSVNDTGVGISKDQQKTILMEFEQADHTKVEHGGFGLGLYICTKLLEQMNSNLNLKSEVNIGSSFSFTINLPETNDNIEKSYKEADEFVPLSGDVLVVDDNIVNLKVSSKILTKFGLNVEKAEDGLIAFEKAKQKNYDLILMDCQMPTLNGFDSTRKIRQIGSEHYSKAPIIALTANATDDNTKACIDAGMNGVLTKPISKKRIYESINKYFNKDSDKRNS